MKLIFIILFLFSCSAIAAEGDIVSGGAQENNSASFEVRKLCENRSASGDCTEIDVPKVGSWYTVYIDSATDSGGTCSFDATLKTRYTASGLQHSFSSTSDVINYPAEGVVSLAGKFIGRKLQLNLSSVVTCTGININVAIRYEN